LPQELQARRAGLHKAHNTLQGQLERLTEAYLAQVLSLEEYKRRRQDLEQRQQALLNQLRQLEVSAKQQVELAGVTHSVTEFCQRVQQTLDTASFEQKRRLVELLIDRVIVTGDEVEIRYAIPTSSASEHVRFCQLLTDYLLYLGRLVKPPVRTCFT